MPRPFLIALGLGLVAVLLFRRGKAQAAAGAAAQPTQPTPNQGGYAEPATVKPRTAPTSVKRAPIDPTPTAQEGDNYIVHEDAMSEHDYVRGHTTAFDDGDYYTNESGF